MDDAEFAAVRREAGPCPACGAAAALPIVYGLPVADAYERLADHVVFAGCCLPYDAPQFSCSRCSTTWGTPTGVAAGRVAPGAERSRAEGRRGDA